MPPTLLAAVFLAVMGGALACFVRAYATGAQRGLHERYAMAGVALDVSGTIAVLVTSRVLGWTVPAAFPTVALVHRGFAYLSTVMLVVQAVTGARRHPLHGRLGRPFLGIYATTYALAAWAYGPWW